MRHSGHGNSRRCCSVSNSLSLCDDGGIEFFVGEIGVFELMLYWTTLVASNLYPSSVALFQPLLAQPYQHRPVARLGLTPLHPAERYLAPGLTLLPCFPVLLLLELALDGSDGHSEPGGHLFRRAM